MKYTASLFAFITLSTRGAIATGGKNDGTGSMTMSVMGNNYASMDGGDDRLYTYKGTVWAPVTDCKSYLDYASSSQSKPSATDSPSSGDDNSGNDNTETANVKLSIGSGGTARTFAVPVDNSVFEVNSIEANLIEVRSGPPGVECTVRSESLSLAPDRRTQSANNMLTRRIGLERRKSEGSTGLCRSCRRWPRW